MKIHSHEIAMQSQHTLTQVALESQMSFSTVLFDTAFSEEELKDRFINPNELAQDDMFYPYQNDVNTTIGGIIQNLLSMLRERREREMPESPESEPSSGIGFRHFSLIEKYQEEESLSFSTLGHVQTDSGSIDLNLNFSMSRSFAIENSIDVYSSFDPLVINLEGDIPQLSSDTFSFDLDNDGEEDQISKLKSGNGFLALDKNGDGIINQGSELFGTITGNGFDELSAYDGDGNHWIDESDTVFDSLRIWLKDEETNEKELVGLGEVGIGAIFLDSASSEFTYKTEMNESLGEMRSCGIFLNEDGSCGNISQIDFVARSLEEQTESSSGHELEELLQA